MRVGHFHFGDDTSAVYGCLSERTLNECASNQVHTKEIWIMEIHSYHSH